MGKVRLRRVVRMGGMLLFDWYLRVSSFLRMDVSLAIVSSSASPVMNVNNVLSLP